MPFLGEPSVLRWSGDELRRCADERARPPLVVDSWLVDDGRVRGYDLHWSRFAGSCAPAGIDPGEIAGFRAAVTAALPRSGRWFPRLELLSGGGGLRLRLRHARPRMGEGRVLLADPGDRRRRPRTKGPDLALLLGLRADAVAAGADEMLVRDADGRLVEGALNSLLWWEGDTLYTTAPQRTLPSVTRALLLAIAADRGVATAIRAPLAADLDGREAWLANAANGICVVTGWAPDAIAAGPPRRAAGWQAALDATARHLDELGDERS